MNGDYRTPGDDLCNLEIHNDWYETNIHQNMTWQLC